MEFVHSKVRESDGLLFAGTSLQVSGMFIIHPQSTFEGYRNHPVRLCVCPYGLVIVTPP